LSTTSVQKEEQKVTILLYSEKGHYYIKEAREKEHVSGRLFGSFRYMSFREKFYGQDIYKEKLSYTSQAVFF